MDDETRVTSPPVLVAGTGLLIETGGRVAEAGTYNVGTLGTGVDVVLVTLEASSSVTLCDSRAAAGDTPGTGPTRIVLSNPAAAPTLEFPKAGVKIAFHDDVWVAAYTGTVRVYTA